MKGHGDGGAVSFSAQGLQRARLALGSAVLTPAATQLMTRCCLTRVAWAGCPRAKACLSSTFRRSCNGAVRRSVSLQPCAVIGPQNVAFFTLRWSVLKNKNSALGSKSADGGLPGLCTRAGSLDRGWPPERGWSEHRGAWGKDGGLGAATLHAHWHLVAKDAAQHPTVHRTVPTTGNYPAQMSLRSAKVTRPCHTDAIAKPQAA